MRPSAPPRVALFAGLALSACAEASERRLTLPDALLAPEIRTIVVAIERGAEVSGGVYDPASPPELEISGPELRVTALGFLRDAEALNLRLEPYGAPAPSTALVESDRAFRFRADNEDGWLENRALADALGLRWPARRPTPECNRARTSPGSAPSGLTLFASAAPRGALAAGVVDGAPALFGDGVGGLGRRRIPPELRPPRALASDGVAIWWLDEPRRLTRFDVQTISVLPEPSPLDGMTRSTTGRVYGWGAGGLYELLAPSTLMQVSEAPLPAGVDTVAVHDRERAIAAVGRELYGLDEGRAWRETLKLPASATLRRVAIDELRAYALTTEGLWVQDSSGAWTERRGGRRPFERLGLTALGGGAVLVFGTGGVIDVLPEPGPPELWCTLAPDEALSLDACVYGGQAEPDLSGSSPDVYCFDAAGGPAATIALRLPR